MASSSNDNQSAYKEELSKILCDKIQGVLNDGTQSTEAKESDDLPVKNDGAFENLWLASNDADISDETISNPHLSLHFRKAIETFDKSLDQAKTHLLSTVNSIDTSTECSTANTNEQRIKRHIFLSYNRQSASDICTKLYDRLLIHGYEVWMDVHKLHGKVLNAMANGIQDSYIVLICYNNNYSESDFCEIEATYAFSRRIDLIPCRLQASYEPDGWLGSIVSTRNYIDFSPPNDFETTFKKLIAEIEFIKAHPQTNRNPLTIQRSIDDNNNTQMVKQRMCEQFDAAIDEFKETINRSNINLQSLTQEERCQLVHRIKEHLFNDTLSASESNNDNDQTIRHLVEQAQNQTELLKKMIDILSRPTDLKTIIKSVLLILIIWTVKTHIIDACIKHQ